MAIASEIKTEEKWWEFDPCPGWCEGHPDHEADAAPVDRHHMGRWVGALGVYRERAESLESFLWQDESQPLPEIHVCIGSYDLVMTPAETGLLIERLSSLVAQVSA